jgi:hypothetical protein
MKQPEARAKVPEQMKGAMASAAEAWVRAQIQLRCLQRPGWEVVIGGFGHDLALVNTSSSDRRTIEIKSRQALPGLTSHNASDTFLSRLSGRQTQADFLIFVWFERGLVFIKRVLEMRRAKVKGQPILTYRFRASGDPALNAWDRLFEERR